MAKFVEFQELKFEFGQFFKLADITDDIIVNLLDKIENRLIKIDANNEFLITVSYKHHRDQDTLMNIV